MDNTLKVTIRGRAGTGKTTLALALEAWLRQEGFTSVKVEDDDLDDVSQPDVRQFQARRLEGLKSMGQKILIETRPTIRALKDGLEV